LVSSPEAMGIVSGGEGCSIILFGRETGGLKIFLSQSGTIIIKD
jgi:hypothetical protein